MIGIRRTVPLLIAAALAAPMSPALAHKVHRLVIHVDSADPKTQNIALNNMINVTKYYRSKGEKVQIELVAYGPGLNMLRSDKSKVKDRVEKISLELDNVVFSACGNTVTKMAKKGRQVDPDHARGEIGSLGRRARDGAAGTGLELRSAVVREDHPRQVRRAESR